MARSTPKSNRSARPLGTSSMRQLTKPSPTNTGKVARPRAENRSQRNAGKVLRDSPARYRLLFERSPLPMWVYSTKSLRFLAVNDAAVEQYGYSRSEFAAMTIKDIRPPEELPRLTAHLAALRSRRERSGPWKHRRKDGSLIDVEALSRDVLFFGEPARLVLANDITDRLRSEEQRHQAEEKYRSIFEYSTEAITQTTPAGRYLTANPAAARMLGFDSPEQLISEYADLDRCLYVQPGRRREFMQQMEQHGEVTGFESEVYRRDGSTVWISENARAIRDEHGTLLYYQGAGQDITARRQAEVELRHAEEKYRRIFEGATEEIVQTTPGGQYLAANPAGARMLGFDSPEQLIAQYNDLDHQFYVKPGRRKEFLRLIEQNGEVSAFESEVFRKDGSTMWISENSRAVRDESGNLLYIQSTAQDITARRQAEQQLQQQMQHMDALRRIDAAISGTVDLRAMLSVVLDAIRQVLEVDAAAVSLLAPRSMKLEVVRAKGFYTRHIEISPLLLSAEGINAMLERRAMSTSDLRLAAEAVRRESLMAAEKFVFYSGIPLVSKGRVSGLLEVFHRSARERGDDWLRLMDALATQTAIAVESALLFQDLQRSNVDLTLAYEATIEGWSRALDLRDRETEGHTLRVAERTLELARSLGVREDDLSHIRRGAMLHDIGKIGVADDILLKPGPLNEDEWAVMRRHPVIAYEMLSPIAYLGPALDIPYCHHEKWDGSGYPRMLKGEQIPLAARMFAVVDVWDALSSERPYRSAWEPRAVTEHLRAQRGSHFDPRVLDAFLALLADS